MHIYYSKHYLSSTAATMAEKLTNSDVMSPDYFLGMAGWSIGRYQDAGYMISIKDNVENPEDVKKRSKYAAAGMIAAADCAMENNTIAGTLSPGYTGAGYAYSEDESFVNSIAHAAFNALSNNRLSTKKVLILDFDGEYGNGTVDMIHANDYENNVHHIDLSVRGANDYPSSFKNKAYFATNDFNYTLLVNEILKNSRIDSGEYSLVLYNAGLSAFPIISYETLKIRDRMVFEFCRRQSVPCAFTISGALPEGNVNNHLQTIYEAEEALIPNKEYISVDNNRSTYKDIVTEMDSINEDALFADGLEDAVIGYTRVLSTGNEVVVYSASKVIDALMRNDDMTYEEALEYAEFNVFCAYMGENTPLFVQDFCAQ